jgi:cysteinyl-tRNA synthetase
MEKRRGLNPNVQTASSRHRPSENKTTKLINEISDATSEQEKAIKSIIDSIPESKEKGTIANRIESFRISFEHAMNDDFNTAKAIGVIFELVGYGNLQLKIALEKNRLYTYEKKWLLEAIEFVENSLKVLGFRLEEEKKFEIEDKLIKLLIEVRGELRKRKAFDLADLIRDRLKELGITLEDLPSGTIYKRG